MKRAKFLLIVLFIKSTLLFSQGVYFKASSNYNLSTSNQQMPEYFTYQIPHTMPVYNISVNEFSVASGVNFQAAAGYSFNDFLSFELKFSTFRNSKKEFKASPEPKYAINGKTNWDLHNYSLLPTFLFGKTFNKSTLNIFVYTGFGFSKLNIKASINDDFREYEFERSNTFSWGYGLEYSYFISKKYSIFSNIGINNTNYKPEKAQFISASYSIDYLTTSEKEIQYVNDITNLELGYNPNNPEIRLKETVKLYSIYWGVGIKYTLKK